MKCRMRSLLILLISGLVTPALAGWELSFEKEIAGLPGGARFIEREARQGDRTVRVHGVFFSEKQARFAVIDNAAGRPLGEAMAAAHAIAGVNGGYFHPDNTPLGLAIAAGQKIHPFERAKLLSGIFVVTKGRPRIVRAAKFTASSADTDALQAGPFLVEDGDPITGLNAVRPARRTVVATDGSGRWALLSTSSATLEEAAAVLSARAVWPDFPIRTALNLDGGSSTGLWAAVADGPFYRREFGVVRNFLAIVPR